MLHENSFISSMQMIKFRSNVCYFQSCAYFYSVIWNKTGEYCRRFLFSHYYYRSSLETQLLVPLRHCRRRLLDNFECGHTEGIREVYRAVGTSVRTRLWKGTDSNDSFKTLISGIKVTRNDSARNQGKIGWLHYRPKCPNNNSIYP